MRTDSRVNCDADDRQLTTYQRLRHEAEDCGYVPTNADELLQQAAAEIDEYAEHHEGHTHETDEATTGDPAGSA